MKSSSCGVEGSGEVNVMGQRYSEIFRFDHETRLMPFLMLYVIYAISSNSLFKLLLVKNLESGGVSSS